MTARLGPLLASATAATIGWAVRDRVPGGARTWHRRNHRGGTVSLVEGPAFVIGVGAGLAAAGLAPRVRTAVLVAAVGAAGFGLIDDLGEHRPEGQPPAKGLRGHLKALRAGRVTTGALKIVGIGATGLTVAALLLACNARTPNRTGAAAPIRHAADVAAAGALIAGAANLANLLDLRPGRVLKIALLTVPALTGTGPAAAVTAAVTGAGAALLVPDLGERGMLGDCGANAVGAVLGANLVLATAATPAGRVVRLLVLASVTGLTLISEKVSFTAVIEANPVLRRLDAAGRRRG